MSAPDPTMLKPWFGTLPRLEAPELPGYVLRAHERFDLVPGSLVGMALMPFWGIAFSLAVNLLGGRAGYGFTADLRLLALGSLLVLVVLPVVHEVLHGLVALLCGARPSYGVGPGFAYTTFREPLGKWRYLSVGLAPLVVVSLVCVVWAARWDAGAGWLVFFAAVNAGGAIGDLWMAWRIVQHPRHALFFDLADGFAVLVADDDTGTGRAADT